MSTTKLPPPVFVYTQLDLNASWIAHSSFISRGFSMCLGSGFNPFLWWRTGHTGQPLAAFYSQRNATRNLPAANPFPQQSCLNLETCDVNVLDAFMVDQGEEGVEMAAAGREGINQLRSGLNCTALTVQCRRQDLSPPKTRTRPNCSAIQYPQSAPRHRITASLN